MGGSSSTSSGRNSGHQNPPPPSHTPPYYYPPHSNQNYGYSPQPPVAPNYNYPGWYSSSNPASYYSGGATTPYYPTTNYYGGQTNYLGPHTPAPPGPSPAPYVQQSTKKIKNDVNVRKDSIRFEIDEFDQDRCLISFVLDALYDGCITIYYFAKEEDNCKLKPVRPEIYTPVKVPFQKGLGQKFVQPSGTGIDLGFFALDELSKPSADDDAYPLVISAEVCSVSHETDDENAESGHSSPNLQITQAVIEKNNDEHLQVKVIKQILWVDRVRYELRELFGIANLSGQDFTDDDSGKECVICLTESKDTAVMPCRHLCMCNACAKELMLQTNKCPICREPIQELVEVKLDNQNH